MTFRTRLLRVILGLVAATTAACLVIALQQGAWTHSRMVDRLFSEQMQSFQREQELQLANAADRARLAQSVRLFAALEAGDPETYKIAADELRLVEFDFFRLATADGEIIEPPEDSRAGLQTASSQAELHPQLKWVSRPEGESTTGLQLGYVNLSGSVHRVLAGPITGFDSTVGRLFLGQRLDQFSRAPEAGKETGESVVPALWLGGRLLGGRISQELQAALLAVLTSYETGTTVHTVRVDNRRYRVQMHLLNPGSAFEPAVLVSCFSLAEYDAQQRLLVFRVIGLGLLALGVAAGVAWRMARQIAEPVSSLVAATQEIQRGNYTPTITPGKTVELARLAQAFHEMGAGLALKDRYHNLLGQVADEQVAEQLLNGTLRLGGELREVTVIFCDIRGYTELSAGRDPVEVIDLLNEHMGAMTRVVRTFRGVINQFAGDAIMVLFGAPSSDGHDATRAARCALAMMAERETMNATSREPLRIGIGLATGKVVAGCIGGEGRSDYTVVGEKVNLASRLCSVAPAGQTLLDEETALRLPAGVVYEEVPPLTLKGFANTVPARRLLSLPAHESA